MATHVLYHCPCDTLAGPSTLTPSNPPSLPAYSAASNYSFHSLDSLFFCDECDALRCNRCVTIDISSFFCPNCLFEVPGASVKAEKNRCARNCFLCPCCTHTLSVLASDGEEGLRLQDPEASIGNPPYYLGCSCCKWDSKSVGLVFEKPTGLSLQLQKYEDGAPDNLEFDKLQNHFEPFVRSQVEGEKPAAKSQAAQAASAALKNSKPAGASGATDELKPYQPLTSWTSGRSKGSDKGVMGKREEFRRDYMHHLKGSDERVSSLQQRWTSPWDQPIRTSDLRPTRVPLKSKQSKRCPACRHIIIKPDIKAASDKFKIKLVALNYLPEIQVDIASTQVSRRTSTIGRRQVDQENLQPGRAYSYELSFINPLDDAIKVKIAVARVVPATAAVSNAQPIFPELHDKQPQKGQRSGWSVVPTTTSFPVDPYSEVWELDEEEALLGNAKKETAIDGVLKRRGHTTTIGLDLTLGKETQPNEDIQVAMLVTFSYQPEMEDHERIFTFWTAVRLGRVSPDALSTISIISEPLPAIQDEA